MWRGRNRLWYAISARLFPSRGRGKESRDYCGGRDRGSVPHGVVKSIGSREEEEEIARHLYGVLRDFDSEGVDVIYSEAFYTPKMGQAIMNRLLKAAGHKIIHVKEEEET